MLYQWCFTRLVGTLLFFSHQFIARFFYTFLYCRAFRTKLEMHLSLRRRQYCYKLSKHRVMHFSETVLLLLLVSYILQYCAKVMQAKCANFVLCSRELSTKVRAKVRAKIRGVSSENSLEQRAIFLRIFGTSQKIRDN